MLFDVLPVKYGDVTDTLHHLTAGLLGNLIDHLVTLVTITGIDPYLDEFMRVQRRIDFIHDIIGNAMLADDDDDFPVVGEFA